MPDPVLRRSLGRCVHSLLSHTAAAPTTVPEPDNADTAAHQEQFGWVAQHTGNSTIYPRPLKVKRWSACATDLGRGTHGGSKTTYGVATSLPYSVADQPYSLQSLISIGLVAPVTSKCRQPRWRSSVIPHALYVTAACAERRLSSSRGPGGCGWQKA